MLKKYLFVQPVVDIQYNISYLAGTRIWFVTIFSVWLAGAFRSVATARSADFTITLDNCARYDLLEHR